MAGVAPNDLDAGRADGDGDVVDGQGDLPDGDIASDRPDAPDAADAPDSPDSPDADLPLEPEGPPEIRLTVNELPAEVDGTQPYFDDGAGPFDFRLTLPTWDFTLDVYVDRDLRFIDLTALQIACEGATLSDRFEARERHLRWLVEEIDAFAEGSVDCTARVSNLDGEQSNQASIAFDTVVRTPELNPFDPVDTWLVTFSRDRYSIELTDELEVESTREPDGRADFLQDLALVGLQGDESGEGASTVEARGQVGVNAIVAEWIIDDSMRMLRTVYGVRPEDGAPHDEDSVRILIYREGDHGAPEPPFDGTFSIHGVGGEPDPSEPAQFGRASAVDRNNASAQDDSRDTYGSFTTNMMRTIITNPAGALLLDEFLPVGGVPIGESDLDALLVVDDFDPATVPVEARRRRDQLVFEIELLSKALGSLIAHEMGHSVGLVICAPPPFGLFSGTYDDRWMAGDPGCGHIDTPGLNIMQTGTSLLANPTELFGDVAFSPLNLAYLRGRVLVLPRR